MFNIYQLIELVNTFFHSSSQKERVMSLFKRQLAVPLLGIEELINDTYFALHAHYRGLKKGFKKQISIILNG